nr:hypothetical protein [Tanacetum cinerariifolium]
MSDDRVFCRPCTCEWCTRIYTDKFCSICCFESGNAFIDELTANYFDDLSNSSGYPPQHQTHSFESYNDNPNYGYPPQEPFVFNQDPGENSSQSPPHIDHHCCYGCGDSLDSIFYHQCTCKSCGNGAHYGYNCQPKVLIISNPEPCHNQNVDEKFNRFSFFKTPKVLLLAWSKVFEIKDTFRNKQYKPEDMQELIRKLFNDVQNIHEELAKYINTPSWNHPAFYNYDDDDDDDDEDYTIAITPVLSTKEPVESLIMEDEHLDTILATKSDEVIKSSVEDLVPMLSESKGILDNMCDVPFSDKNLFDAESDLIKSLLTRDISIGYYPKIDTPLEEFTDELAHIDPIPPGIDETDSDPKDDICFIEQLLYDDTLSEDDSFEDIDYVEASPPDSKIVILEEVKDEILHAKLLNIHLLIAKIESLNNNPTPDCVLKSPSLFFLSYSDNSLPEFETFSDHTEETSSDSTTTNADNSLPEYDSFLFEIELDLSELSSDSGFSSSDDSFGSGLEVSFPSVTRNKIFDPGIFIEVQSERLLSREEFSISFIHDPLYPVFDTLLSFSSKNEDKVFKPGILSYLLVSHRDKTTSDFLRTR